MLANLAVFLWLISVQIKETYRVLLKLRAHRTEAWDARSPVDLWSSSFNNIWVLTSGSVLAGEGISELSGGVSVFLGFHSVRLFSFLLFQRRNWLQLLQLETFIGALQMAVEVSHRTVVMRQSSHTAEQAGSNGVLAAPVPGYKCVVSSKAQLKCPSVLVHLQVMSSLFKCCSDCPLADAGASLCSLCQLLLRTQSTMID